MTDRERQILVNSAGQLAAAVALLVIAIASACGQITVPPVSPEHSLIEIGAVKPDVAADCKVIYEWKFSDGIAVYTKGSGQNLIATGRPGKHVAQLRVTCIDWTAKTHEFLDHRQEFVIGKVPDPAPPRPDPPTPPQPTSLCHLVTPEVAVKLQDVYDSQANVIATIEPGWLVDRFLEASNRLLTNKGLLRNGAYKEIDKRLNAVLGDQTVFTAVLRDEFVVCLRGIAADLECEQPVPPVPSGSRVVILVRET